MRMNKKLYVHLRSICTMVIRIVCVCVCLNEKERAHKCVSLYGRDVESQTQTQITSILFVDLS